MVNVRKRGKVYEYSFDVAKIEGKRKRITKSGFKTKVEAQEAGTGVYEEYIRTGVISKECQMSYYDYLPKFMQGENEFYRNIIETKSNIFKAYSKLDAGNWDEISTDIQNATNLYSQLLTNPNLDINKMDSINKSYIMLNELQNAASLQDASIFLIKYKNLIEELNNI